MNFKLKRWRTMRVGEVIGKGDQIMAVTCEWTSVSPFAFGKILRCDNGGWRTRRPLPKFYAKK